MVLRKHITLIGFMGAGKSTLGAQLAGVLGLAFIDLDKEVEASAGMTIREIFGGKGESYFRELERKVMADLLSREEPAVIALGGGTPCFFDNIDFINKHSHSIYLKCSPETLLLRLKNDRKERPLLAEKTQDELLGYIRAKLEEREGFYQMACWTVES